VGLQAVDDKSRVALPSALRVLVERNLGPLAEHKEGRVLTITSHERDPCLVAYDEPWFDQMMLDVESRARAHGAEDGAINDWIVRLGTGVPENASFDANGRFILPAFLKAHAGIGRHAFFYGRISGIEIWDPATLMAFEGAPPVLREACRFHMERNKVAL
jgi:MraZ protein